MSEENRVNWVPETGPVTYEQILEAATNYGEHLAQTICIQSTPDISAMHEEGSRIARERLQSLCQRAAGISK